MKTNNLHEIAKKLSDSIEARDALETRNSDSEDFFEMRVRRIEAMLKEAFGNDLGTLTAQRADYGGLLILAKDDNVSKEDVNNLLRFYTDTLCWGMDKALNYTIELFANGTIAQIKALNKEKSDD